MKEQPLQENESSYKLFIDILADLVKEYREMYTPSPDIQKDEAPRSE